MFRNFARLKSLNHLASTLRKCLITESSVICRSQHQSVLARGSHFARLQNSAWIFFSGSYREWMGFVLPVLLLPAGALVVDALNGTQTYDERQAPRPILILVGLPGVGKER